MVLNIKVWRTAYLLFYNYWLLQKQRWQTYQSINLQHFQALQDSVAKACIHAFATLLKTRLTSLLLYAVAKTTFLRLALAQRIGKEIGICYTSCKVCQ